MSSQINLKEIKTEAISTMPPIDGDNNAAWNYAQRMLTKLISETRKSNHPLSDNEAQQLRQSLDSLFLEKFEPENIDSNKPEIKAEISQQNSEAHPDVESLKQIISNCFHTSTDGSNSHKKFLQQQAKKEATDYLSNFHISWFEMRKFKKTTREHIQEQLKEIIKIQ